MKLFGTEFHHQQFISLPRQEAARLIVTSRRLLHNALGQHVNDLFEIRKVSSKSVSATIEFCGARAFTKIYFDRGAHLSETLAYTIFAGLNIIPAILYSSEEFSVLVLQEIKPSTPSRSADQIHFLFRNLGLMHGAWEKRYTECSHLGLTITAAGDYKHRSRCSAAENEILDSLLSDVRLRNYIPISIGDAKEDHLLISEAGTYLVDFDALALGRWDPIDLVIALARSQIDLSVDISMYLAEYDAARKSTGSLAGELTQCAEQFRLIARLLASEFSRSCHIDEPNK